MKHGLARIVGMLVVSVCAAALHAQQDPGCQSARLEAFDPGSGSNGNLYGFTQDIWGDWAVVGDLLEGIPTQPSRGAVYVYERCGLNWFLHNKFVYSGPGSGPNLGSHVRMDEGIMVTGAPGDDDPVGGSGSAFVYELQGDTWAFTQKLLPSVQTIFQDFGDRVDTDGNSIIIGARGDTTFGLAAGAIFVFDRINGVWTETARLFSSTAANSQNFGQAFAFDGDRMLVGVELDDEFDTNAGLLFVFDRSSGAWVETGKVFASDAGLNTNFGHDIDVDGNRAVAISVLSAYVLEESGGVWSETARLVPSDGGLIWSMKSCALDGDTFVVGASSAQDDVTFVFQLQGSTWTQVDVLVPTSIDDISRFADDVVVEGDTVLVGTVDGSQNNNEDTGSTFVFSISGTSCPSLTASPTQLSLSQGGTQVLNLAAGPAQAGTFFALIGSASGTDPGFVFQSLRIPLLVDDYTLQTLVLGPPNPLLGNAGVLGQNGNAQATLNVPPGSDPSLVGLRLFHAFVAYTTGPLQVGHVSNFVEVFLGS